MMDFLRKAGIGLALTGLGGMLAVVPAHAQGNLLADGSFETPDVSGTNTNNMYSGYDYDYYPATNLDATSPDYNPWTYFDGGAGIVHPPSAFDPSPTGYSPNQYAFLQNGGAISQTVTVSTPGIYDLSFLVGGRANSGSYDGAANDTVTLEDMGVPVHSNDFGSYSGENFTPTYETYNLAAGSYTLTFQNTETSGDHATFIDDANLSLAPEPAQMAVYAFVALGLGGLMLRARKRQLAA